MPGFSLGGALAGLGLFANDYLKKKQVDLQIENQRMQQQQRQRQDAAAAAGWNALQSGELDGGGGYAGGPPAAAGVGGGVGGGSAAAPFPILPGSTPQTPQMAGPPGSLATDSAGTYRMPATYGSAAGKSAVSRYSPTDSSQYGSGLDRLTGLGVAPEVAGGFLDYIRRNESGLDPRARNPTSGAEGIGQWLGPRKRALEAQYGPNSTAGQQYDFMGQELQGSERATLDRLLNAKTSKEGYDIAGVSYERPGPAALAKAGVGARGGGWAAPMLRDAAQTSRAVAQTIDPIAYGRASLSALAKRIDVANPGADPAVKMMALEGLSKLLAPSEQRAWEMLKTQHEDDIRREIQERGQQFTREQTSERERFDAGMEKMRQAGRTTGEKVFLDPQGNEHWVKPGQDIPAGWRESRASGGAGKVENVIAYKGDEKVFEGSARYDPQLGWVNTADNKPIEADRFESTTKGGAGGGRAGAQVQRQIISGREIQSDLENLTRLPVATNRGVFGGRQQGPGLMDALKENMAEQLTDEDAQLANSALSGIGRELSIVTSPVYGGHWASDQFNALTLKPGQPALVKVYNIARMRQVADNALEGIENTDWVGAQQKKYAQKVRADINKAVPWTTHDVLDFRDKSSSGETFAQFIKRNRIGAAAQAEGGDGETLDAPKGLKNAEGQPAQNGDSFRMKDGSVVVYRDGKLIKTPGAVNPQGPVY